MVDINNTVRAELSNNLRELTCASSNSSMTPFGPICQKASLMVACQSIENC